MSDFSLVPKREFRENLLRHEESVRGAQHDNISKRAASFG